MYPEAFEYFSPETLEGAIELLSQYGEEAKVLAGGQSLIPLMKLRLASPKYLIYLGKIQGLSTIQEQDGMISFGALTSHAEIEESRLVQSKLSIMHDAVSVIGDVQIRNMGTIGGSVAHADPAGDMLAVLFALDARVNTLSSKGKRTLKVDELIVDAYSADLAADEVLTEVLVPVPQEGSGGAYVKFERRAGDFAVASVGVQVSLKKDGTCQDIAIGLGAVGLTAIRARKAEALLRGKQVEDDLVKAAAVEASAEADPFADIRGAIDYKRHLVGVLLKRAFEIASRRARGEEVKTAHF
ncbi:MAG: xanthine dehydrogenase family protein subunit M [Acidobacteria bacterium]|nr:xanthine dehydrogenase family protein subunit M [Acidobacteriota bacterium]MCZ6769460.1 xanthine dehydrogenase family protein subunit M [Acidobacteriota bacterium]MCZ6878084.1 xanthine dehydrogenase family protein subunit M [Acidobacteriota bacterium]